MSRSSGKGQIEPLAALVAVSVMGFAVVTYVGAVELSMTGPVERDVASPTLDGVLAELRSGGLVRPSQLPGTAGLGPTGHRLNVSVTTESQTWTTGPIAPPRAARASKEVPIRVGPNAVRPGRVTVEVWT